MRSEEEIAICNNCPYAKVGTLVTKCGIDKDFNVELINVCPLENDKKGEEK